MTKSTESRVVIKAPNFQTVEFKIKGTAPYVQLRFSEKVKAGILKKMATEGKAKKADREVRDYQAEYQRAMYESEEGWRGIPASAFRNAMVSACRTVNFKMTLAKLSVFVAADGFDKFEGTPLVKIEGVPELCHHVVRNSTGVIDVRTRAMWKTWSARVCLKYDADQFSQADIANLLMRVGAQVGIGEGRPDSKNSTGMGWGLFDL